MCWIKIHFQIVNETRHIGVIFIESISTYIWNGIDEMLLIPELNVVHWLMLKKEIELCWTINVGVVCFMNKFHVINS